MTNLPSSQPDRQVWIAAASITGIGFRTLAKIEMYLSKEHISWWEWWVTKNTWQASGLQAAQICRLEQWQDQWSFDAYSNYLAQLQLKVLTPFDDLYPALLKEIPDRPAVLFVKGSVAALQLARYIAVVGTRRMSQYGSYVTRQFVQDLTPFRVGIVSGSMYGVDVLAHRTALEMNATTVAVLGYGHGQQAEQEISKLHQAIVERESAIISEYPPWISANRGTFPARNRIVAGISQATVVIEAPAQSGSHITANLAAEYGREVAVFPGPISSVGSEGVIKLVNQGAKLIRAATQLTELLNWQPHLDVTQSLSPSSAVFPKTQDKLYRFLCDVGPQTLSQLTEALECDSVVLMRRLVQLQALGIIEIKNMQWGVTGRVWHNDTSL